MALILSTVYTGSDFPCIFSRIIAQSMRAMLTPLIREFSLSSAKQFAPICTSQGLNSILRLIVNSSKLQLSLETLVATTAIHRMLLNNTSIHRYSQINTNYYVGHYG